MGWEDPLGRERLPTPVFWPGEFHELYSPWRHEELTGLSDSLLETSTEAF